MYPFHHFPPPNRDDEPDPDFWVKYFAIALLLLILLVVTDYFL